jgi:hypothetical protein
MQYGKTTLEVNDMNKQIARMLMYMDENGSITTREAMLELGIASPTKRISEMVRMGIPITKKTVAGVNRYGEIVHFMQYSRGEV